MYLRVKFLYYKNNTNHMSVLIESYLILSAIGGGLLLASIILFFLSFIPDESDTLDSYTLLESK